MTECPECKQSQLVHTKSDIVCSNCGLCVGPMVSAVRFNHDQEGNTIPLVPIQTFGTTLGTKQERKTKFRKLMQVHNNEPTKFSEARLVNKLTRVCSHLGVSKTILHLTLTRFKLVYPQVTPNHNFQKAVVAAICLLTEIRRHDIPIRIRAVCEAFQQHGSRVTPKKLMRAIQQNHVLHKDWSNSSVETYLPKAVNMAVRYLTQNNGVDSAKAYSQIRVTAIELLETQRHPGRKPYTVAAAAVYAACRKLGKVGLFVPMKVFEEEMFVNNFSLRECWVKDFKSLVLEGRSEE